MMIKWPWTRAQVIAARPDMTRRRFLTIMAAAPVAAALAPELVDLLKPPKIISLPPASIATPGMTKWIDSKYLTGKDAWFLDVRARESIPLMRRSGMMNMAAFKAQLQEGLNKVYDQHPTDWRGVFGNGPKDLTEEAIENLGAHIYDRGMGKISLTPTGVVYDHIPDAAIYRHVAYDQELKPGPREYEHQRYALGFKILPDGPVEDLTDHSATARQMVRSAEELARLPDQASQQLSKELLRHAEHLSGIPDSLTDAVNGLPAAAEQLARDIVTAPVDLVKRILRG